MLFDTILEYKQIHGLYEKLHILVDVKDLEVDVKTPDEVNPNTLKMVEKTLSKMKL
jgi:hypothetical protein